MYKKILATAVACVVAAPAMALTVYEDDSNKLTIGGRVGMRSNTMDGHTSAQNDSARINFGFEHKINDAVTGFAKAEWGYKAVNEYGDGSEAKSLFNNRLGNVGLRHETLGSVTAGKQWSVYSEIANWTDVYPIGGGKAMGMYEGYTTDGGVNGTGRADDAVAYRGSLNGLNVGVQYQMRNSSGAISSTDHSMAMNRNWTRKAGAQAAISYDFDMGMSVGYTYNQTSFENRENAHAQVIAVKYDSDQVYLAAAYGDFKNHTNATLADRKPTTDADGNVTALAGNFDKRSSGIELFARYDLKGLEGVGIYSGWNQMKVDKQGNGESSKGELNLQTVGTVYNTGPMQFAAEYTRDKSKKHDGKSDADNYLTLQARYYF